MSTIHGTLHSFLMTQLLDAALGTPVSLSQHSLLKIMFKICNVFNMNLSVRGSLLAAHGIDQHEQC